MERYIGLTNYQCVRIPDYGIPKPLAASADLPVQPPEKHRLKQGLCGKAAALGIKEVGPSSIAFHELL
jgi:hypothetical protein